MLVKSNAGHTPLPNRAVLSNLQQSNLEFNFCSNLCMQVDADRDEDEVFFDIANIFDKQFFLPRTPATGRC